MSESFFHSLLIGQLGGVLLWFILGLFKRSDVPRARHRASLPMLFRAIALPVDTIVFFGGRWMPLSYLSNANRRLQQAGVETNLDSREFLASKVIAMLAGLLSVACLYPLYKSNVWILCVCAAALGWTYPDIWLRRKIKARRRQLLTALPFYLDIITLCVEAGSNLTGGLMQAVSKSTDSALRHEVSRVLREIRSGKTRAEALREFGNRSAEPAIVHIVFGLIQAETSGASLAPMLRAQSEQLRGERFQRAEKTAMEAPVKLLAPLFLFIFPTTFIALGFLILSKAVQEGVLTWAPVVWAYHWPGLNG